MKKLELHRKKCEQEGKYLEARAASLRLAELKAKEAQRMRAAILQRQVGIRVRAATQGCTPWLSIGKLLPSRAES